KVQTKSSLPTLSVLGGYSFRGTGIGNNGYVSGAWKDGFSNSTNNLLVGLGITWNLTNVYTNKIKSQSLLRTAQETDYIYNQTKRDLNADLAAVRAKLKEQQKVVTKTEKAVKGALN